MKKRVFTFRNLILTAAIICMASLLGPFVAKELLRKLDQWILDGKMVHEAQGRVVKKEYVKFNETNNVYKSNNGTAIEAKIGEEHWRIYFKIDSFDYVGESKKIDESLKEILEKAEEKRCQDGNYHYTIQDKEAYDRTEIGDKLAVSWQRIGGNQMQVVTVFPKRKNNLVGTGATPPNE
jgi:hypothetical protein